MTLSCKASGQPPLKATPRSLPPELILAVLHFAVPFCTFDDFASRSASLRAFSLVSSAWRIAQLELFAHPVLPTAESARLLRVAIAGAGGRGEGLAEAVRTLRVGDERRALHYGLVADLLPLLTNLEEVWLLNVDAVVLEDLAGNASASRSERENGESQLTGWCFPPRSALALLLPMRFSTPRCEESATSHSRARPLPSRHRHLPSSSNHACHLSPTPSHHSRASHLRHLSKGSPSPPLSVRGRPRAPSGRSLVHHRNLRLPSPLPPFLLPALIL
jgi:hypothetical protein